MVDQEREEGNKSSMCSERRREIRDEAQRREM